MGVRTRTYHVRIGLRPILRDARLRLHRMLRILRASGPGASPQTPPKGSALWKPTSIRPVRPNLLRSLWERGLPPSAAPFPKLMWRYATYACGLGPRCQQAGRLVLRPHLGDILSPNPWAYSEPNTHKWLVRWLRHLPFARYWSTSWRSWLTALLRKDRPPVAPVVRQLKLPPSAYRARAYGSAEFPSPLA